MEGRECCLIHCDNPVLDKGVWLNPNVRVAYRVKGGSWFGGGSGGPRTERVLDGAVGFVMALLGLPWGNGNVAGRVLEWG